MSGRLATIGINSDQALTRFAALQRQSVQVSQTMTNFGGSIGALRERLNLLRNERDWIPSSQTTAIRTYTNEIGRLERQIESLEGAERGAGRGISTFGIAMGNMLGNIGTRVASGAISAMENVFKYAAKREQDIVGLSTFVGNKAQEVYKQIQNDAMPTPFTTQSLLAVNRALISTGLDAQLARKDALNLANAISATGGGNDELERMAVNMQQIRNAGKATALDIRQFAYAGINIYGLLEKATGKNAAQVRDMDVSYNLLSQSLAAAAAKGGMYYGALEKQGQTLQGRLTTIKDKFQITMTELGTKLTPLFTSVLTVVNNIADKLPVLTTALQPLFDQLAQLPVGEVITMLAQIAVPIMQIVVPVLHYAIQIFNNFWSAIQPAMKALMPILSAVAFAIQMVLGLIADVANIIISHLAPYFTSLARIAGTILVPALILVGKIFGWLGNVIGPVLKLVMKFVDAITWAFNKVADFLSWVGDKLGISSGSAGETTGDSFIDGFNASMSNFDPTGAVTNSIQSDHIVGVYRLAGISNAGAYNQSFADALKAGSDLLNPTTMFDNKFKISAVQLPGQNNVKTVIGSGDGDDTGKSKDSNSVATGGQKNVTVNMSIGKMFPDFKVVADTVKEGAQLAHDTIVEHITRAVATGASLGGA